MKISKWHNGKIPASYPAESREFVALTGVAESGLYSVLQQYPGGAPRKSPGLRGSDFLLTKPVCAFVATVYELSKLNNKMLRTNARELAKTWLGRLAARAVTPVQPQLPNAAESAPVVVAACSEPHIPGMAEHKAVSAAMAMLLKAVEILKEYDWDNFDMQCRQETAEARKECAELREKLAKITALSAGTI